MYIIFIISKKELYIANKKNIVKKLILIFD